MKHRILLIIAALSLLTVVSFAQQRQAPQYAFTEASELTIAGKLFPNTPTPYHRGDTIKYKGFTRGENEQLRMSSGLAVCFKTNSSIITVTTDFTVINDGGSTGNYALRGYDLYIKKDGEWVWAGANCPSYNRPDANIVIARNLGNEVKECMMYLPLVSAERSIKIGIDRDAYILPIKNPFRHRIGIFGSSFTHGISTTRPGMAYPAQLGRMTGLGLLSIACSGNCKLQSYFANMLKDADVEAYLFDAFSNPSIKEIDERLFPFIETIQSKKPGIPLIFMKTIWREANNFDQASYKAETERMAFVEKKMKEACEKYKNVYYVTTTNASLPSHDTSVDGVHPGDHGYTLWAESVKEPILEILAKYGIK